MTSLPAFCAAPVIMCSSFFLQEDVSLLHACHQAAQGSHAKHVLVALMSTDGQEQDG